MAIVREKPVFQDRSVEMISNRYTDAVDDHFQQIRSGSALPSQSVRQLVESGFVIIPGPTSGDPFNELTAAYDEVMAVASGPDFKIASTTIRMLDLLHYGPVFDDIYLYPSLLEACSHIIGEPFKLSKCHSRRAPVHSGLLRSTERAVRIRLSQSPALCGPHPHEPPGTLSIDT